MRKSQCRGGSLSWVAAAWIWVSGAGVLVPGAGALQAADWPQFLGPTQNGVSTETNLLDKIPEKGLKLIWERTLGTGYSVPSVRGGRLVFYHRAGDSEVVECVEAATGKSIWRYATPTRYMDPYGYNNGPRCTPLLTDQFCYVFGVEGRLSCLEFATGKKVWERETAREFQVPEAFFGVGSTPVLEGDKLIVMVGGQPNSGLVALDAKTGRTLWESVGEKTWQGRPKLGWPGEPPVVWNPEEKIASYSSPLVTTLLGRRVLLAVTRQGLVGMGVERGDVLFSRWFRSRVDDSVNAMTPVVHGDRILISSAYYRSGSVQLRVKPDLSGFDETWRSLALEMHWSQPILVGNHLYGFSGRNEPDARLRCVEWETGKLRWERDEQWRKYGTKQPPVFGRGSLIHADGKLIALGEGGLVGIFKPNPDACEEVSRWQAPGLHYPCWGAPVLSDRRLYLQGEDRIVCYDFAR